MKLTVTIEHTDEDFDAAKNIAVEIRYAVEQITEDLNNQKIGVKFQHVHLAREGEWRKIEMTFKTESTTADTARGVADGIRALAPDPSFRVVTVEQLERWVEQWAFTVDQYTEGRQVSDRATIAEMRSIIGDGAK